MTATPPLKPWREVVRLKDELRNNALPLSECAADLHEAALRRGRQPVYEAPETFFALTCPTLPLRGLVRETVGGALGRWLELADGSGPLDCEFDRAGNVRLKPAESDKPPPPPPEAVLDLHGIEELADAATELLNASAGAELRFRLRAVFKGAASPEVRARVDALLAKVSETLKTQ